MPWTPILARLERERQAAPGPVGPLAGDREQLIGLINACQQSLTELLHRLHAAKAAGRDPEGPAQSDLPPGETERAERLIVETIGRLDDIVPGEPAPTVRPEELDAVRAATEQLAARLASIDRGIEERMVRTADLAARGAEIAVQDRMKAVRGEVEAVRSALGETASDLRGVVARHAAARGSELTAVRTAIDGVQSDLARLDGGLDERIASKVDAAWRAVDAELTRLHARLEALVADASAGTWERFGRLLGGPVGAVAAVAGFVLRRLIG